MPTTHNKNRTPLLYLIINCISARSPPHILPLKDEYTLHFLNFLVIILCNSLAKSEGYCFLESELELMPVPL